MSLFQSIKSLATSAIDIADASITITTEVVGMVADAGNASANALGEARKDLRESYSNEDEDVKLDDF